MNQNSLSPELLQKAVHSLPEDNLSIMRLEAADRFSNMGFPVKGSEDWKYTDLSQIADLTSQWLNGSMQENAVDRENHNTKIVESVTDSIDAHWIVVRDGVIDSDITGPNGTTIKKISTVNKKIVTGNDAMSVFNAALLRDGIHITAATPLKKPIGILYIDGPPSVITQNRAIIEIEEECQLQVVEVCLSAAVGKQFTNTVTDFSIAAGASVNYVRIQDRDFEHTSVNRVNALLEKNTIFNYNGFDLGGALTRNDIVTEIAGEGALVNLNGLYLASARQHIDNHTNIIHTVGPSTSTEEYRGIISGDSQCVFNGRVFVAKGADGTDSNQYNHNLLLSERAEIDTKPELEIYADDVKCAHGATVGQLDESALFYLRSRGLNLEESQRVLTHAFASGTLSKLTVEACYDYLTDLLDNRLELLVGAAG